MIRPLLILVALLSPVSVHAGEFPCPTPRCGKNFITLYQTGSIDLYGNLPVADDIHHRTVRKSDILSMTKHPGKEGAFIVLFRSPGKPGYEIIRVARNTYVRVLECLD